VVKIGHHLSKDAYAYPIILKKEQTCPAIRNVQIIYVFLALKVNVINVETIEQVSRKAVCVCLGTLMMDLWIARFVPLVHVKLVPQTIA
jgi:hypothetical protein